MGKARKALIPLAQRQTIPMLSTGAINRSVLFMKVIDSTMLITLSFFWVINRKIMTAPADVIAPNRKPSIAGWNAVIFFDSKRGDFIRAG